MLIIGARGHAREILDIIEYNNVIDELCFFDDVSTDDGSILFNKFRILKSIEEVKSYFQLEKSFILGIGGANIRYNLCQKMEMLGGVLNPVISDSAKISKYIVNIGDGVNIMHNAFVSSGVSIGKGTLINYGASVHHDSTIGRFCEISPNVIITGNVSIGDFSSIGSGAIILPKVVVGANVTIGAGAVVTSNIDDNSVAVGVPAKIISRNG